MARTVPDGGPTPAAPGIDADASRRSRFGRFRRRATDDDVVDLDDDTFTRSSSGSALVIDFWAPWCTPCKLLHPLFAARAAAHAGSGVRFVRVDVERSPLTAATFGIVSIPTVVVVDPHGEEIDREVGVPSKRRLEQLVRNARSTTATANAAPGNGGTS